MYTHISKHPETSNKNAYNFLNLFRSHGIFHLVSNVGFKIVWIILRLIVGEFKPVRKGCLGLRVQTKQIMPWKGHEVVEVLCHKKVSEYSGNTYFLFVHFCLPLERCVKVNVNAPQTFPISCPFLVESYIKRRTLSRLSLLCTLVPLYTWPKNIAGVNFNCIANP